MKTRTVKKPAVRRDEILDSAARLIYTKGYEQMTIQDILDDLKIAKGTVYHYFNSKQALLEAFIDRIQQVTENALLPIIADPDLNAVEKLQGFFDTLDTLRSGQMAQIVKLALVWYTVDNAIVREKVNRAVRKQRAPLLVEIVRQGLREGVFRTAYPEQSGGIILSLLEGMGSTHIELLLSLAPSQDDSRVREGIEAAQAAYMDAVERVLGAAPYSLRRIDPAAVQAWAAAFRENLEQDQ